MTDWDAGERSLADAGHAGFERDAGETAVPGLSGEWLVGRVERERAPAGATLPLPWRVLDALPFVAAAPTGPEAVPEGVRAVAADHGLDVVVVSTSGERVRVALVDRPRPSSLDDAGSP